MRTKRLLVLAAVLIVVGFALTQAFGPEYQAGTSTAVLTSTEETPDRILFYTSGDALGVAAIWVASMILADVVGFRLARR